MKNQNTILIIVAILVGGAILYFLTRPKEEAVPTGQTADPNANGNTNSGNISCTSPSTEPTYNIMYNTLKPVLVQYMDAVEGKQSPVNVSQATKNKWKADALAQVTTVRMISGKGLIYLWRGLVPGTQRNFVKIAGTNVPVPDSVLDRLYMDLDSGCIV
jgi:hypothetical protein